MKNSEFFKDDETIIGEIIRHKPIHIHNICKVWHTVAGQLTEIEQKLFSLALEKNIELNAMCAEKIQQQKRENWWDFIMKMNLKELALYEGVKTCKSLLKASISRRFQGLCKNYEIDHGAQGLYLIYVPYKSSAVRFFDKKPTKTFLDEIIECKEYIKPNKLFEDYYTVRRECSELEKKVYTLSILKKKIADQYTEKIEATGEEDRKERYRDKLIKIGENDFKMIPRLITKKPMRNLLKNRYTIYHGRSGQAFDEHEAYNDLLDCLLVSEQNDFYDFRRRDNLGIDQNFNLRVKKTTPCSGIEVCGPVFTSPAGSFMLFGEQFSLADI